MFKVLNEVMIDEADLKYLSDTINAFLKQDKNIELLDAIFQKRYETHYRDDSRRAAVYQWHKDNGFKIGKFFTFQPTLLNDSKFNDIVKFIFKTDQIQNIAIQALNDIGNYLIPHIDRGTRFTTVLNFPISNWENSESIFYSLREGVNSSFSFFTFDEIKELQRFSYTKNYIHSFDASIPHSVYSEHEGFRIMLSYSSQLA